MSARAAKALVASGGAIVVAIGLLKPWEGKENHAYRDVVNVLTICWGETKGVKPGDFKTDAECETLLLNRIERDFYKPLVACVPGYTTAPVSVQASMLSLAYNVGTGAVCRSTAAKHVSKGEYSKACFAMTRFNRAGGKVIRGLKLRREYGDADRIGELELCLEGLPK